MGFVVSPQLKHWSVPTLAMYHHCYQRSCLENYLHHPHTSQPPSSRLLLYLISGQRVANLWLSSLMIGFVVSPQLKHRGVPTPEIYHHCYHRSGLENDLHRRHTTQHASPHHPDCPLTSGWGVTNLWLSSPMIGFVVSPQLKHRSVPTLEIYVIVTREAALKSACYCRKKSM